LMCNGSIINLYDWVDTLYSFSWWRKSFNFCFSL
jgi:hypothetical protein